jgi:hypothetical protein
MRLTINGDAVTFSLEDERTLGEVAGAVERWLATAGFAAVGLSVDGEHLPLAPGAPWRARPVEGIDAVAVDARPAGELRREHWVAAAGVLGTFARVLDDGGGDGEVLAAADEAVAAVRLNPAGPDAASVAARLADALAGAAPADLRAWPPQRRAAAAGLARDLAGRLADLAARTADPVAAVAESAAVVAPLVPGLAGIAVQLQTGRDREAMAAVTVLCDAVQRLLPLVAFLPRDPDRERLTAELNAALRDLLAAFEAKDTVLIGDLAEYEVAPRLAGLLPLLGRHP